MTKKPLTPAQRTLLRKDVLGQLINALCHLPAFHGTEIHQLLDQAWQDADPVHKPVTIEHNTCG